MIVLSLIFPNTLHIKTYCIFQSAYLEPNCYPYKCILPTIKPTYAKNPT